MRLVIFGVPNQVSEEEIISAMAAATEVLGVNIRCSVLDRKDILPSADEPIFISRKEDSEYIEVFLADKKEAERILEEERVSVRCAYLLMQFLHMKKEAPFAFLD